jgi:hypothetical protein
MVLGDMFVRKPIAMVENTPCAVGGSPTWMRAAASLVMSVLPLPPPDLPPPPLPPPPPSFGPPPAVTCAAGAQTDFAACGSNLGLPGLLCNNLPLSPPLAPGMLGWTLDK